MHASLQWSATVAYDGSRLLVIRAFVLSHLSATCKGAAWIRSSVWCCGLSCLFFASLQVNQLLLTRTWSNITFDSMAVENLAPGDAKSAELARPLSVSSANNFWPLYYNRSQDRLFMKNVTHVVGSQVGASGSSSGLWSVRVDVDAGKVQEARHVRMCSFTPSSWKVNAADLACVYSGSYCHPPTPPVS